MFTPRTNKPGAGNKFYITKSKGGYSTCIQGSPTDKDCNVLANCVGYACGRFNEIIGSMKYPGLNCNAENFIERAKSLGLEVVDYPVLGGIMVMQKGNTLSGSDGAGHVFMVEKLYDKNHMYTSESGYGSSAFWNSHRYNTNGRWGHGSGYKFRGCIVNPAVGKVTADPEKEPTVNPTPTPTTLKYKKGDKIILNGYLYRDSKGNGRGRYLTNYKGTITITANGTKPYHIDSLGWVAESDIKLQNTTTKVYKKVANCTWLNLRTAPSYGNNVYRAVRSGTVVEYLGVTNGWAKVD
jgi:hypothetical protein